MKPITGETGTGNYVLPPAETLPGICVAVVDLGTQITEYKGVLKDMPKIAIVWELESEDDEGTIQRHLVIREVAYFFSRNSNLRKLVEKWLSENYADDYSFDPSSLLGEPCLVSIGHKKANTGKDVYEIGGVVPLGRRQVPITPTHEPIMVELEDPVPEWIPWLFGKKVSERRAQCHELRGKVTTEGKEGEESEIPF